jgi:hypothetical protein
MGEGRIGRADGKGGWEGPVGVRGKDRGPLEREGTSILETEIKKQKTENGKQKTENGKRKTENKKRKKPGGLKLLDFSAFP